ncbi:type I-E CRISPR-associated protein Cas7/Cse4/CasC [Photobacterium angustum]|uniref:Type I-E CRISPR-associated protein Cas7/Cse4/CasC n=1 Tax=Photobacterium angustum TaxID=661 RepID=A0A855S8C2_PHOAN|nr:type I-E CRISPR-associated protein Cas7/Cse4/CasC [Photobacterium angustum]KJF81559.1 CRISPR-associated protein Cse4 [Photobacterium damselae subsp. damselae]KJG16863.1 CRISPR-associated protein Cse4 [Photobacterium angustum]KJG23118.1 CRISPR-associated protein Cse4 [Photobacterium angustum]KJG30151.1 CRISPR-associated protein Cse4 [Photobacterium angustum]KJG35380.1 CRISPR-associated protein Cse4 [Photobacterium angustum]
MSQFIQLHTLTSYAPSNLNRDDLGRPKTAKMGGFDRLRVSSQSQKRHWRTSDLFEQSIAGNLGIRTKRFGQTVFDALITLNVKENCATEWARLIAGQFGKLKKDSLDIEQLAHISPVEKDLALSLVAVIAKEDRVPTKDELKALKSQQTAVDIALFGRMLASEPEFNVDAACQVAHALSVHQVTIEDDYFTAVDDLNDGKTDSGSAHIGEAGFASALFYNYICINKTQLVENLSGDEALANAAIAALTEAVVKVSPTGKQNSFASRAYASYVMAEKGQQQPRSLSVAFLKPINDQDMATAAIDAISKQAINFDNVYGACAESRYEVNAMIGKGSFAELCQFVTE